MTVTTFQRVTARAERKGRCPICDKPVKRTATFEMTVSPFNKHKDGPLTGQVRTPREVLAAVQEKAANWAPPPELFTHERCAQQAEIDAGAS